MNPMRLLIFFLFLLPASLWAQPQGREPLYFPEADAAEDISQALGKAREEGKHVMLQIGGNWCVWCYRFHDFVAADSSLSSLLDEHYVVVHVNYSPENKNEDVMASLGFPQRFGFPVFVVLGPDGNLLHTQNSAYLEAEKSYDAGAVGDFFRHWSPQALDPASYQQP